MHPRPIRGKIGECRLENQEGVVVADVDLALLGVPNFFGDTTGHYCNPAVYLEVNTEQKKIVRFNEAMTDGSIDFDRFINC